MKASHVNGLSPVESCVTIESLQYRLVTVLRMAQRRRQRCCGLCTRRTIPQVPCIRRRDQAIQLQNQEDTLATRMTYNVGPIGSDQQCVNPIATPTDKRRSAVNWSTVNQQLLTLNQIKNSNVQVHQPESQWQRDGRRQRQRSTSSVRSNLPSRSSFHSSKRCGTLTSSQNTTNKGESSEHSAVSSAVSGMFHVFEEEVKAQSIAEIAKKWKNSLSDFIWAIEAKYPETVQTDRGRRDILVNH